jgi:hypothetical protein
VAQGLAREHAHLAVVREIENRDQGPAVSLQWPVANSRQ